MALATTMLDSVATIFRASSVTRDANQGTVQVWTVFAGPLACSMQQAGVSKQQLYNQNNAMVGTTLYFAQNPGPLYSGDGGTANDLVTVTNYYTGLTYNYLVQGNSTPVGHGTDAV